MSACLDDRFLSLIVSRDLRPPRALLRGIHAAVAPGACGAGSTTTAKDAKMMFLDEFGGIEK